MKRFLLLVVVSASVYISWTSLTKAVILKVLNRVLVDI